MLTADEIKKISALAAQQAEERSQLMCRQANERAEMDERFQAQRAALGIGPPVVPGSSPVPYQRASTSGPLSNGKGRGRARAGR